MGNKLAGLNRVTGLRWENRFQWACKEKRVTAFKIPLGARQVSATKLLRVQTPFDWVLVKNGMTALIDTKHCETKTLSKSRVTPHQMLALKEAHEQKIIAGYVVHFVSLDQVIFFDGAQLERCFNGQALYPTDGLNLGGHDNFDLDLLLDCSSAGRAKNC